MDVNTMFLINYIEIAIHIPCLIFQISVVIFLFKKLLTPKSMFCSAYFAILNTIYFTSILFMIVWIYGHLVLYSKAWPWMPGVYFISFHAQGLLGIWETFLALNRCTALAFPVLHRKIWSKKFVPIYIIFIEMSSFIFHWYVLPNFECRFLASSEKRCQDFLNQTNANVAYVNIFFGLIALGLIIVGVFLTPKLETSQKTAKTRMERRLIYQTIFSSSMLVLLYTASFIDFIRPFFLNVSYAIFLLQFYPQMIILFFISPMIREEFAKFYGLTFFLSSSKIGGDVTMFTMSTVAKPTRIT